MKAIRTSNAPAQFDWKMPILDFEREIKPAAVSQFAYRVGSSAELFVLCDRQLVTCGDEVPRLRNVMRRSLTGSVVDRLGPVNRAILWQQPFAHGKLIAYGPPSLYEYRHNPATPSPCADAEEKVFAFAGTGELICMDRDGGLVWQRNMVDDYGPYDLKFGMASSPRLWGDKLLIAAVHKGPSYVVALNKDTGVEMWLADRNYPALGDATDAYTSPMVLEQPGRRASRCQRLRPCGCL